MDRATSTTVSYLESARGGGQPEHGLRRLGLGLSTGSGDSSWVASTRHVLRLRSRSQRPVTDRHIRVLVFVQHGFLRRGFLRATRTSARLRTKGVAGHKTRRALAHHHEIKTFPRIRIGSSGFTPALLRPALRVGPAPEPFVRLRWLRWAQATQHYPPHRSNEESRAHPRAIESVHEVPRRSIGSVRGLAFPTIPLGTTPATYYILGRVDVSQELIEGNEANNLKAKALAVTPLLMHRTV